jgi:hypothetical protein
MSLLFLESFDWLSQSVTTANIDDILRAKYSFVDVTAGSAVPGANAGNALNMGSSNFREIMTQPLRDPTVAGTCFVGFRFKLQGNNILQNSSAPFVALKVGTLRQLEIRPKNTGQLTLLRSATTVSTSDPLFHPNQGWMYLEFKLVIASGTGGSIEMKRDGVVVWAETGLNTHNDTAVEWSGVEFGPTNIAFSSYIDDIYVCDSLGTVNNDYLGDVSVQHIIPDGDGTTNTFTASGGGTQASHVDEATAMLVPIDETDYLTGDASAEKSLFTYAALATSPGLGDLTNLIGVQVNTYRRSTAELPLDLDIVARSGTTEGTVSDRVRNAETLDMFSSIAIFELNPDTAAAWTVTNLNAAEFGVEIP